AGGVGELRMSAKRAAAVAGSSAATADGAAPTGAASAQAAPTAAAPRPVRRARLRGSTSPLVALLWLGPALVLIAGVVIYPAIELVQASFTRFSITGLRTGSAGTSNYGNVLHHRDLVTVLTNTVAWVVAVLVLTILVSLAL